MALMTWLLGKFFMTEKDKLHIFFKGFFHTDVELLYVSGISSTYYFPLLENVTLELKGCSGIFGSNLRLLLLPNQST